MAAYYHGGAGTDIQSGTDGLQTLYLMNPSYAGYGDAAAEAGAPAAANMMFLNSAVTSMTPASFGHHHQSSAASQQQHFVGIPLQAPPSGYNLWTTTTTTTGAADMSSPPPHAHAHGAAGGGGVSAVLSLSSRETPPVTVAAVGAGDVTATPQGQMVMSSKYLRAAQQLLDEVVSVSNGGVADDASKASAAAAKGASSVKKKEDSEGVSGGGTEDGGAAKSGGSAAAPELSTAERQELQMKKGKLVNMLDEVEQRYRQYHQQMQVVVASFEAVAGGGSARTYTALALRTISRQFRCLRDAIAGQVRAASRALGEDADATAGVGARTVGSRLRYIDHQLRQQRALQQLGMMQSSAWRPQRGLPERSVSILRAWLFEHFLHPYPKDSDKIMLAKQTGLTRSQVSNWFINARVRLWKPMVEEMYLEETKDKLGADPDAGEGNSGSGGGRKSSIDHHHHPAATTSKTATDTARMAGGVHASMLELAGDGHHAAHAGFYGEDDDGDDGGAGVGMQHGFKKARTSDEQQQQTAAFHHVSDVQATLHAQAAAAAAARHDEQVSHRELLMKFMESGSAAAAAGAREHHHDHAGGAGGYSLFAPAPYGGQFGSEQFTFAGQHGGGGAGGVSLTLGLPHGAGEQTASFLMSSSSNGSDGGGVAGGGGGGYDMNMQSTKSFAAQLMRDFVA